MAARKKKPKPIDEWQAMAMVIEQQNKAIIKLEETVNLLVKAMCLESRRKVALNIVADRNKKG